MNTLAKPHFSDLPQGECAGAPILLKLWDRFDFSFLLTQSGINKVSGVPTWMTAFLYVAGFVANCASVAKMAELAGRDALLRFIFQGRKITQCAMSRFLTASYSWSLFGEKRVARLQEDPDTKLREGDVIALDDTLSPHLDLAQEMLLNLRKTVSCRLWVAMDRWYLAKEIFSIS